MNKKQNDINFKMGTWYRRLKHTYTWKKAGWIESTLNFSFIVSILDTWKKINKFLERGIVLACLELRRVVN